MEMLRSRGHPASSGPSADLLRTRGNAAGPERPSHLSTAAQRPARPKGKGTCHRRPEISSLGRRHDLPFPGPAAVSVNSAAPRGSAPGPGERAPPARQPGRPSPPPPCRLPRSSAGHPPGRPGGARGGAQGPPRGSGSTLPFRRQTSPPYLFGGLAAAAQPTVSAAHPPPGAPGRRLRNPGPPENPAARAPLPAARPPARAAGETLKLNLKAQT